MSPQEAYAIYLGLTLHFTEKSYDYTKYGPRMVPESKMGKNYVLASHISGKFNSRPDMEHHLIGVMKHKRVFLKEILSPENMKRVRFHNTDVKDWRKGLSSDLERMMRECGKVEDALKIENELVIPPIGRMLLNGDIRVESYVCLDKILGFNKKFADLVWKDTKLRMSKYASFFSPRLEDIAKVARPFFGL